MTSPAEPSCPGGVAEPRTEPDRAAFPSRAARLAFALLILVTLGVHVFVQVAQPAPRLWGDEPEYADLVRGFVARGDTGLLPGTLPFEHRSYFAPRLLASLRSWFGDPSPMRTASVLNTLLLPLVLLTVYLQGRWLGLSWRAAWAGAALLALSPWFGFHVHSLWPEVLHAVFLGLALTGLLHHIETGERRGLVLGGVATAYALFTKGMLGTFLPVIVLAIALAGWRSTAGRAASPTEGKRLARVGVALALYLGTTLLFVGPQLLRNHADGHGWRLSAQRWWNLEVGITARPPEHTVADVNRLYLTAADGFVEREERARERVLAFVREQGFLSVAGVQLRRLGEVFVKRLSSFEMSLLRMERWGPQPPWWIAVLERPARGHWYALLVLAALGIVRGLRPANRRDGWVFLAAFLLCFLAALAAVPMKIRFVMPILPILCLFAAGAVEGSIQRALRRRAT